MCRRKSHFIKTALIAIVFIFSCNLDTKFMFNQDSSENDTLLAEERCIQNGKVVSNIDRINNFLKDLESGKSHRLFGYLADNVEWIVAGDQAKVPFAGAYYRINAVSRYLRHFHQSIMICDLMITSLTELQPDYLEAYIRLQGKIRSTGKTIDIEFLYALQMNDKHKIDEITVSYPLAAMELAFTRGGKGQIVADLSASELALAITNVLLPAKNALANATTVEQVRTPYTPSILPSDAALEQVSINGVPGELIHVNGEQKDKIIFHMHGGGFVSLFPARYRSFDYRIAKELNIPVLNADYRLAPENPFSASLDDCYAVYTALLNQYKPDNIIFLGDSAGGSLIFAVMLLAREHNLPLPGAAIALAPWVDLTNLGETMTTNAESDTLISSAFLNHCANWYLAGTSPVNPLASPLFGDFDDLPPVYFTVSSTEVLLSDSIRMFKKISSAGGDVTIEIKSNLCHVWPVFCFGTSDTEQTVVRIGNFIKDKLNF